MKRIVRADPSDQENRNTLMRTPFRRVAALLSLAAAAVVNPAIAAPAEGAPQRLTVLASQQLTKASVNGVRVRELSGLAWDADENRLYVISDRGALFHFRLRATANALGLEALGAWTLAPPPGSRGPVDAEGLSVRNSADGVPGNSELLVATEGQPQVIRYSTQGEVRGLEPVAGGLDARARFRGGNAMLEALGVHPVYGLLVAAEAPLEGKRAAHHRLLAQGQEWLLPRAEGRNARLKAMEVLADGRLLVLERVEPARRKGGRKGLTAVLRTVDLQSCGGERVCEARTLARREGADAADNFEGMSLLGDERVLIVSDDRGKAARGSRFVLLQLETGRAAAEP